MTAPYDFFHECKSDIGSLVPMGRRKEARPPANDDKLDRSFRLYLIERALKFDPDHPDRRALVREYLDLTEPVEIDDVV